uniref:Uncharacterized protein n=1 Tax=Mastacembelus armatus TaxID=205130 RepID=A0A3Q3KTQ1_9TELE
ITREASFSARDAFISPSATLRLEHLTFALASRLASASAAMALWTSSRELYSCVKSSQAKFFTVTTKYKLLGLNPACRYLVMPYTYTYTIYVSIDQ